MIPRTVIQLLYLVLLIYPIPMTLEEISNSQQRIDTKACYDSCGLTGVWIVLCELFLAIVFSFILIALLEVLHVPQYYKAIRILENSKNS